MSDNLIALILGVIQGLTEFLPVSSSGHLELAKFILGDDNVGAQSLLMTVVLHFGTALATIIFFKDDIITLIWGMFKSNDTNSRPFALNIIISMIPATFVGIVFEKQIESFFSQNIVLVCIMLIITGILLFFADRAKSTKKQVNIMDAFFIGIAQAIAILPGISRSGATISTSTIIGIDKEEAARFSFLMVVPLIFGKMFKDVLDGEFSSENSNLLGCAIGFTAALITGYFACKWMIAVVKRSNLKYFGYYCLLIGFTGIIINFINE
jgi:undecaprenyl-diphosphatase